MFIVTLDFETKPGPDAGISVSSFLVAMQQW